MERESILLSLVPVLSTIAYMTREPSFSFFNCIPYILPLLIPLIIKLPSLSKIYASWLKTWRGMREGSPLDFTARLRLRSWLDEPDSVIRNFSTMLWEWNRVNKTVNCKNLMEEALNVRFYEDREIVGVQNPIFVDDPNVSFWNSDNPDIHYTMWMERISDRDGATQSELFLKISFISNIYKPSSIVEHIEWLKTEAKRVIDNKGKKQKVLVSTVNDTFSDKEKGSGAPFMVYEFSTTSSFDNFFSEESSIVSADLDHFFNNKAAYARTGRPWTYTVLNEGLPGVGKTKLVKAICARTGSTLIVLNLKHISNVQTLYDVFHSSVLSGEHIPHDRRVYYIPEVDTQIDDMLKAREPVVAGISPHSISSEPARVDEPRPMWTRTTEKGTNILATSNTTRKLTLGEILNVLDGVPERHGHIVILDTNHISALDPALVRPGRVDRILSWRKMKGEYVRKYLENFYETAIPKSVVFPDDKWTPAELQALAYRHGKWIHLQSILFASAPRTNRTKN